MKKAIWLSYDLGLKGDYENLYEWLDKHDAIECGDSVAFIKELEIKDDFVSEIKNDLRENVDIKNGNRIYMIWYNSDKKKVTGSFLFGSRKKSPWQGYSWDTTDLDGIFDEE